VWAVAALVGLQALGLVGVAVFYGVDLVVSTPDSAVTAVVSGVLALAVGVGLLLVAGGLARRQRWARSPALVAQLLLLPVGWDVAHGERVLLGVALLVWAAVVVVLLFSRPVSGRLTA
jgi:hypothetical protein